MEINLLVLNVGSSRLSVGVFVGGSLEFSARIAHDNRSEWAPLLTRCWGMIQNRADAAVAGASVNPAMLEPIEHEAARITGTRVQWVGRDLDLPIPVRTDSPQETGVDRIVNVAAAYEQLGHSCVVVDAGTAVTVDCCNDAGEFVGGAIAPGAGLMLDALHSRIPRLPRVELATPKGAVGRDTRSAINLGVYQSLRGLVKEVTESYATELGRWPEIIATGGDAAVLFEGWELIHAVAPDLTLYGIALAFTNHHLRHGT
jgi:type III pantothenate kinase